MLPVLSRKNASATTSLLFFKNFTGFLFLFAFSLNLQSLPSASLTTLSQLTFHALSLSISLLAHFDLLLKNSLLFLLHLFNQLLLAPFHLLFLESGILSLHTSETSLLSLFSNLVSKPIFSNLPITCSFPFISLISWFLRVCSSDLIHDYVVTIHFDIHPYD